jgi:hypothetical protein
VAVKRIRAKGNYWNEVQDKAVVDYQKEQDQAVRNRIFEQHLYHHLCAMAATILRRYYKTDNESLVLDSVTHVVEKAIDKFDPSRAKSYSFFQTVIKHFFYDLLGSNGISRRRAERLQSLETFDDNFRKELQYSSEVWTEQDYRDTVLKRLHLLKRQGLKSNTSLMIEVIIDLLKRKKMYSKEYVSLSLLIALNSNCYNTLNKHARLLGIEFSFSSVERINKILASYAKEHGIQFYGHDLKVMEPWHERALGQPVIREELALESI